MDIDLPKPSIRTKTFLLEWIIGSILVWPLWLIPAFAAFAALAMFDMVFQWFDLPTKFSSINHIFSIPPLLPVYGLIIGFMVGKVQHSLLRKYDVWTANNWRLWSAVGGLVVGLLMAGMCVIGRDVVFPSWIGMPFCVFVLSCGQLVPLHRQVDHSWYWLLANLTGGIVFGGLVAITIPYWSFDPNFHLGRVEIELFLILWIVAALLQGLITGAAILYLFQNKRRVENDIR